VSDIALYSIHSGILSQWIFENRSDAVVLWSFIMSSDQPGREHSEQLGGGLF